jgi:hypothetical protein
MKYLYRVLHLYSFGHNTVVTVGLNGALPLLTARHDRRACGYAPTDFRQKWIYTLA